MTVPSGTTAGTYYLLACADNTGTVAESDETNNCTPSSSAVLISGADLIETAVSSPPATAVSGGSFSVTDTVKNQGNASATASTTRYYLSTDGKAKNQLLTGSRPILSLAAGATNMGATAVTIPSSMTAGTYFLLACADGAGIVAESNETNNCMASTGTVQVTP